MVKKLKSPRRLIALAIFSIVALSAFGFAASNSVSESNAGDGSDDVTGGAATSIHYVLSAGAITEVHFNYSAASVAETQAFVELRDGTTVLGSGDCVPGAPRDWECVLTVPVSNIVDIDNLRVVTAS